MTTTRPGPPPRFTVRLQVQLTPDARRALEERALTEGTSAAGIVRKAVTEYLARSAPATGQPAA